MSICCKTDFWGKFSSFVYFLCRLENVFLGNFKSNISNWHVYIHLLKLFTYNSSVYSINTKSNKFEEWDLITTYLQLSEITFEASKLQDISILSYVIVAVTGLENEHFWAGGWCKDKPSYHGNCIYFVKVAHEIKQHLI